MNLFVTNEEICASKNGRKFFKAEEIKILKKSVMEKFYKNR